MDFTLVGANEKDLLEDPATGHWYVAKLGGRNSDLEVATEYIIYLVGRTLGARIAEAKLTYYRGRLRFLSRYFLNRATDEELVHGIQLFERLLDEGAVQQVIKKKGREQELFTFQAIVDTFAAHYVEYERDAHEKFFDALVDMIIHDAIIGLQDRHHSNWGVIVQRDKSGPPPRFAPLYDSARGLFCNHIDTELVRRFSDKDGPARFESYVTKSKALIGFTGVAPLPRRNEIMHEQLVAAVFREYPASRSRIRAMLGRCDWRNLPADIRRHLGTDLCSGHRMDLILKLLRRRVLLVESAIATL